LLHIININIFIYIWLNFKMFDSIGSKVCSYFRTDGVTTKVLLVQLLKIGWPPILAIILIIDSFHSYY
jgi:hypothetical protein